MFCAVWTMIRALRLDTRFPLVPLSGLTPFLFPVAVAATGLAAFLRRRPAAAVAGASAFGLGLLLAPRAIGGADDVEGRPLRVMAANVYRGRADAEVLAELVRLRRVELLAVQELTPDFVRRFELAGISATLPHSVLQARKGVGGSGVWSAHALRESGSGGTPFAQSGALVLEPGPEVAVLSVHPRPPNAAATRDAWAAGIEALPPPAERGPVQLLLGDFNATLDNSVFLDLLDGGYADAAERMGAGLIPTWPAAAGPSRYLPMTIDHLVYDRDRAGVRDYAVLGLPGSDHHAIYAELVLKGARAGRPA